MKRCSNILLSLILITSIVHAQSTSEISAVWRSVEACNFTLIIPSDVQNFEAHGIDSCVKHYRSRTMFIDLDVTLGSTANDERYFRREGSDGRNFNLIETKVNSKRALITTFYAEKIPDEAAGARYAASLFIPRIGKYNQGLWMRTYSTTREGQVIAQKIFKSIRLSPTRRRA